MTCPPLTRLAALTVAASLSLGTAPVAARAAPSERDVAYELGVQAEAAGDPGRAAAAFERAYRLTAPAETGPRLLFLRASVGARLRAAEASPLARVELCLAQVLLHDYLDPQPPPPPGVPDPTAEERRALGQVEQQLGATEGPDCPTLLAPAAPTPPPEPVVTAPEPAPEPVTRPSTPQPAPAAPVDRRRRLQVAGGVTLGVGAIGLALLATGVVLGRKANARGHASCREGMIGCNGASAELRAIEATGRRGDLLVGVGAVLGGLGLVSGALLLAVGLRRRSALSWTPQVSPSFAGLLLSGRF